MSLRNRSILLMTVIVIAFMGVSYIVARLVYIRDLEQLEQSSALESTQRVVQAYDNSLANLVTLTTDYARWNDTYRYSSEPNSQYIDANYIPEVLTNLKLNAVIIVNAAGKKIFSIGYDFNTSQIVNLSEGLKNEIDNNPSLITFDNIHSVTKGTLLLPEGPLLVVAHPILKSDGTGPINGTLVMGRYLLEKDIQQYAAIPNLSVRWSHKDDPTLLTDFPSVNSALGPTSRISIQVSNKTQQVVGYALLNDIQNQPVLILQALLPRTILEQGSANLDYLLPLLLAAGLILGIISYIFIQPILFGPLASLHRSIQSIRSRNDLSMRIPVTHDDALGTLAVQINDMLARLELQERDIVGNKEAQRRAIQTSNLMEIMQIIHALGEPKAVLRSFVETIGVRFGFYYIGVFLLDETGLFAVLNAGSSDYVPEGHRVAIGGRSSISTTISTGQPQKTIFSNRLDQTSFTRLPLASAEIVLPLRRGEKIIGAMIVQSTQADAFENAPDIEMLQIMADNLAIALKNAEQIHQLQTAYDGLQATQRQYMTQQWTTELQMQEKLDYEFENPMAAPIQPESEKLDLPLMLQGLSIGQVSLESDRRSWSSDDRAFIQAILEQTALALENARLFEQSRRRAAQERLVADITRMVRTSTSVDSILSTAVIELGRSLKASSAQVQIQPNAANILLQSMDSPQSTNSGDSTITRS